LRFLTIGRGAQTVGLSSSTVKNSTRGGEQGRGGPGIETAATLLVLAHLPSPHALTPYPRCAPRGQVSCFLARPRKHGPGRNFFKFRPQDMLRQTWLFSLSTQHSLSPFSLFLPRNFNLFQGRGLPHVDVNSCHRTGNRVRFHPVLSSSRNVPWVRRGPCIVTDHCLRP